MGRNTQYYNQSSHSVIVSAADGSFARVLSDFAEGDAIGWEPTSADRVAVTEGLDGARISFAAGCSGKITVKLKPTSPDVGFLTKIYNLNRTNPVLLNVTISTGVDETHSLTNAGVTKPGGASGSEKMGEREFSFIGEKLNEDESE